MKMGTLRSDKNSHSNLHARSKPITCSRDTERDLLAHILHRIREVGEDLVLFGVNALALGVDPPAAFAALHHPGVVIVVIVAALAERAVGTLLLLVTAVRAEG